jgi:hypothetical protein
MSEPDEERILLSVTDSREVAERFRAAAAKEGLPTPEVVQMRVAVDDVLDSHVTEEGFVHDEKEHLILRRRAVYILPVD